MVGRVLGFGSERRNIAGFKVETRSDLLKPTRVIQLAEDHMNFRGMYVSDFKWVLVDLEFDVILW